MIACSFIVFIGLILLVFFSYYYHLALAVTLLAVILLGISFQQLRNKQRRIEYQFNMTSQGVCTFDDNRNYQLQASSRLSFLGCWLNLTAITTQQSVGKYNQKQLFIYRDSLSEQELSRLSKVLNNLASS